MGVSRSLTLTAAALLISGCVSNRDSADLGTLEGPQQDTIESTSPVLAISFSNDSRYLAHLTRDEMNLWDVLREENTLMVGLPDRSGDGMDLASSTRFAIVAEEGIQVWDSKRGRQVASQVTLPLPGVPISMVFFDSTSQHLAATLDDGSVMVWNLATSQVVRHEQPLEGTGWRTIRGSAFGVLFLHRADKVRVLDLGSAALDVTLEFDRDPAGGIAVALDGRSLASTNPQGSVEIRKLPEGTISSLLTGFEASPRNISLSPDGSVLAVAMDGYSIELWDTKTNERLDRMGSTFWPEGGIVFSSDGNSLAWVEGDRTKVRYWSPVLGVVERTSNGSSLIATARPVCPDTASIIRFRLARDPFERGVSNLQDGKLEEARTAFAEAQGVFPNYPGLMQFAKLTEERYEASLRADVVEQTTRKFMVAGEFQKALAMFEEFLRDYGQFGDHGFRDRAATLSTMIKHLELAVQHRTTGDDVSAIVEFSLAAELFSGLVSLHPEYETLREKVLTRLDSEAEKAFLTKEFADLLDVYADLIRLRPLDAESLLRAGTAHENLGNKVEAVKAYEAIAVEAEQYIPAHRSLARMAKESGDLMQAKITLSQIRKQAPNNHLVAAEYAEVIQLMKNHDEAVSAWNEVARMRPRDPRPLEIMAKIEEERGNWEQAGSAFHEAVRRSGKPRPLLLLRMAECFDKANMPMQTLAAYVDFLELNQVEITESGEDLSALGPDPGQSVHGRIRELGFIQHRGKWIYRDQFLFQQGWVLFDDEWVRPEEAKLREVASLYAKTQQEDLRVSTDLEYTQMVGEKKISNGMNREEVIRAWGFFNDQNVLRKDGGKTVFEQMLFPNSRQVYLKNGLVCFWSE